MNKLLDEMSGIRSNAVQEKFHVSTPMAETVGEWGGGGEGKLGKKKEEKGGETKKGGWKKGKGVL